MVTGFSALGSDLAAVPVAVADADVDADPDPDALLVPTDSLLLLIRLAAVELRGMVTYWLPSVEIKGI